MPISGAHHHSQLQIQASVIGYSTSQHLELKVPISYQSTSGVVATIPANSVITKRIVVRETPWNIISLFAAGRSDSLDLLIKNYQHNLSLAFAGATEIAGGPIYVPTEMPILFTWDHGGATQGEGYVLIEYTMLEEPEQ
ncbi:MAG: hypothetical protein BWY63_02903 [Chloroflexi bacterium ADurb.Bin360]|jgi:hypothetical protein|nr:hypothetical protein [Anaerolineae bacterium]OQA15574.1 MAG: hypothetical protein BWY63_02903 [Chloroflexi bacterium ADurb.Bin360]